MASPSPQPASVGPSGRTVDDLQAEINQLRAEVASLRGRPEGAEELSLGQVHHLGASASDLGGQSPTVRLPAMEDNALVAFRQRENVLLAGIRAYLAEIGEAQASLIDTARRALMARTMLLDNGDQPTP